MSSSTRAGAVAALFLGGHVFLLLRPEMPLWGLDLLGPYGTLARLAFFLLSATLIVFAIRGFPAVPVSLPRNVPFPGRSSILPALVAALVAVGLFFGLRSAVHILGDGNLYIREVDTDLWSGTLRTDRAPLTFVLIRLLHRLGAFSGETTYQVYSVVSGGLFVFLVVLLGRRVGRSRLESGVLIGFLLTAAFLQIFFGYAENYALPFVVLFLFLACGILDLRGRRPPWISALCLGVLIPLHFVFLALLPALAWIGGLGTGSPGTPRAWIRAAGFPLLGLGLSALILAGIGIDPIRTLWAAPATHLLPLSANLDFHQHYRLLSFAHALDLTSLVLLVAPIALMAGIVAGWTRPDREVIFCFLAAAGFGVFAVLANPEIGVFRDWDVLALGALPWTLGAALHLVRAVPESRVPRIAGVLVGAALLHTAAWIGINADRSRAEARFRSNLEHAPLSRHARSYGWETLAALAHADGRINEARFGYRRAVQAAPGNPRHWISLGVLDLERGQPGPALESFLRARDLDPGRAEAYNRIGQALQTLDRPREALENFDRAVELEPGDPEGYFNRGGVHLRAGHLQRAAKEFREALARNPGFAEAHTNLASTFYAAGRYSEAIASAEEALRLRPDLGDAWYVIGAAHWQLQERELSRDYFREFLKLEPASPNAGAVRRILEP